MRKIITFGSLFLLMNHILETIFAQFDTGAFFRRARPLGQGHINDTFLVEVHNEHHAGFVLQRINHFVFRDIPALTENKVRASQHLLGRLAAEGVVDIKRRVLQFLPATTGLYYHRDVQGNYWNLSRFIPDAMAYEKVESPSIAFEGGRAIGAFQRRLAGLAPESLHDTIPHFHDVAHRLDRFHKVAEADVLLRANSTRLEIEAILAREEEMRTFMALVFSGAIPRRVTHNDTKISNVLFSREGSALCMIDLDTVMPGIALSDFGDAIRSGANPAREDEPDLGKVDMDIGMFTAFAEGYLSEARSFLTSSELEYLAFGAKLITYEQFLRFLMDYLEGDVYYQKIQHEEHNLQRARAQLKLLESMEAQFGQMCEVVHALATTG